MKQHHLLLAATVSLTLLLPLVAAAQDSGTSTDTPTNDSTTKSGWSGSGEFGYAAARGNSHTENINAKLTFSQENERRKNNFQLSGMRSKGDVTVTDAAGNTLTQYSTTANRYAGAASVGYKFDPRSYLVNALRYEHDDFGSNLWQGTYSIGYGYIALKNARTELSFEIGPGYKRYQPAYATETINGESVKIKPPGEHEVIARGLINWKQQLTTNTKLEDTFLIEAGSKNKYYQNDLGLSVSMTNKLAIKLGYQLRYNSNTQPGTKSTDQLYTTNLVYSF